MREKVRSNLLSVLPLIRDHFLGLSTDFYQTVDRRYYPVRRGLMVAFASPMIYGISGRIYFQWLSLWRQNLLARERLSLFVTLIDKMLMQDPDLEAARFGTLDFSCIGPEQPRISTVLDARDIPRVDAERKTAMLDAFAEGYFQAVAALAGSPPSAEDREDPPHLDPDPPSFFD